MFLIVCHFCFFNREAGYFELSKASGSSRKTGATLHGKQCGPESRNTSTIMICSPYKHP